MINSSQIRNLIKFSWGSHIPTSGPLKVEWNVTNRCNSKCKSCERWKRSSYSDELTTEEGKKLLKQLSQNKVESINFSGGEPLLRRDIFDLAEFAKNEGLKTCILTNGLTINSREASRIISCGVDTIYLSLDGASPRVNDELRGVSGSFQRVMAAIDRLKGATAKSCLKIRFSFTANKKNVRDLVDVVRIAYEKRVDGVAIQMAHDVGEGDLHPSKDICLDKQDARELQRQIDQVLESKYSGLLFETDGYYRHFEEFFTNPTEFKKYRCVAGYASCNIEANGDMISCVVARYPMGNIRERPFREVWYSGEANRVRKRIKETRCSLCWMGCFAPLNIFLYDLRFLRINRLLKPPILEKVLARLRG